MKTILQHIISYEKLEEFLHLFYTSNKNEIYNYIKKHQNLEKTLHLDYNNKTLNLLILITTISRSLIEHGVPSEYSLLTAENLMNIMLLKDDIEHLNEFEFQIIDFFYEIYNKPISISNHTIIRILNYVYKNLGKNISLKNIAKHLDLSESYVSNIFKTQMKISLTDYINEQKIERAKQILRDSDNNVLVVSMLTGYNSQSYFSKLFKKFTKMSPSEYRALYRKNSK